MTDPIPPPTPGAALRANLSWVNDVAKDVTQTLCWSQLTPFQQEQRMTRAFLAKLKELAALPPEPGAALRANEPLPEDIGLSVDMLDVDRLREWARLLLVHGCDVTHWCSVPFLAGKMQTIATGLEKAIRDIGVLRVAALPPEGRHPEEKQVEAYIKVLPWSAHATDDERSLVAGNIRTFAMWLRYEIPGLSTAEGRQEEADCDCAATAPEGAHYKSCGKGAEGRQPQIVVKEYTVKPEGCHQEPESELPSAADVLGSLKPDVPPEGRAQTPQALPPGEKAKETGAAALSSQLTETERRHSADCREQEVHRTREAEALPKARDTQHTDIGAVIAQLVAEHDQQLVETCAVHGRKREPDCEACQRVADDVARFRAKCRDDAWRWPPKDQG